MNAYFVRVADTHEPVGIFAARNADQLNDIVDEVCDPGICEFRPAPAGGLLVHATVTKWPLDPEDRDDATNPDFGLATAVPSESWDDVLGGFEADGEQKWRKLGTWIGIEQALTAAGRVGAANEARLARLASREC